MRNYDHEKEKRDSKEEKRVNEKYQSFQGSKKREELKRLQKSNDTGYDLPTCLLMTCIHFCCVPVHVGTCGVSNNAHLGVRTRAVGRFGPTRSNQKERYQYCCIPNRSLPVLRRLDSSAPEEIVCSVCGDGDVENNNEILFCDNCDVRPSSSSDLRETHTLDTHTLTFLCTQMQSHTRVLSYQRTH